VKNDRRGSADDFGVKRTGKIENQTKTFAVVVVVIIIIIITPKTKAAGSLVVYKRENDGGKWRDIKGR
jgi:hypothetical protein